MLPANSTPRCAAWIRRLNPCARLPGSEAAKLGRNSRATHRRGTRGDAPSPGEDYTFTWSITSCPQVLLPQELWIEFFSCRKYPFSCFWLMTYFHYDTMIALDKHTSSDSRNRTIFRRATITALSPPIILLCSIKNIITVTSNVVFIIIIHNCHTL